MTVSGTWSADDPTNPVTMTGSLDVNDIGPVEISCTSLSTEAGCNGNVGGITTGTPDTVPPPNLTPAPCTINGVPVECPAPTPALTPAPTPGGINVTGTWVAPGQPGSLVLTQSGTAITGTAILPPVPNTTIVTNSISGTIVGNTVNLVHVVSLRVVSGPVTVVSAGSTNYSFQASSSSTMSGTGTTTVTVTATCAGEFCPPPTTNTTTTTQSLTITKQ
jgi:hypothetical protein